MQLYRVPKQHGYERLLQSVELHIAVLQPGRLMTLRLHNKGSMICSGEHGLHPHSGGTNGVLCSELSRQGDTELALRGRLKHAIGFEVVVRTYCTAPAELKFGYICRYMEHDKATNIT